MADTWSFLALSSIRSLCLFPMSTLSVSPYGRSRSWGSKHLVRPLSPRLLMNAPEASCMMCAMHGMWFLNAGHSIPEASSVNSSSCVIESFEEAISVSIQRKRPSVSSKQSRTSLKCMASLASVCWPLTYHPGLACEMWKGQAINHIKRESNFT